MDDSGVETSPIPPDRSNAIWFIGILIAILCGLVFFMLAMSGDDKEERDLRVHVEQFRSLEQMEQQIASYCQHGFDRIDIYMDNEIEDSLDCATEVHIGPG